MARPTKLQIKNKQRGYLGGTKKSSNIAANAAKKLAENADAEAEAEELPAEAETFLFDDAIDDAIDDVIKTTNFRRSQYLRRISVDQTTRTPIAII
jgi:hypothetical protein